MVVALDQAKEMLEAVAQVDSVQAQGFLSQQARITPLLLAVAALVVLREQIEERKVATPYSAPLPQQAVAQAERVVMLAPAQQLAVLVVAAVAAEPVQHRLERQEIRLQHHHRKVAMAAMGLLVDKDTAVAAAVVLLLLALMALLQMAAMAALVLHRQSLAVL